MRTRVLFRLLAQATLLRVLLLVLLLLAVRALRLVRVLLLLLRVLLLRVLLVLLVRILLVMRVLLLRVLLVSKGQFLHWRSCGTRRTRRVGRACVVCRRRLGAVSESEPLGLLALGLLALLQRRGALQRRDILLLLDALMCGVLLLAWLRGVLRLALVLPDKLLLAVAVVLLWGRVLESPAVVLLLLLVPLLLLRGRVLLTWERGRCDRLLLLGCGCVGVTAPLAGGAVGRRHGREDCSTRVGLGERIRGRRRLPDLHSRRGRRRCGRRRTGVPRGRLGATRGGAGWRARR